MLNAFSDLLCSNYAGIISLGLVIIGLESITHNANIIGEISSIMYRQDISATTNMNSRADLFGISENE